MANWQLGNGHWGDAGAWSGGTPDATDAVARFDFSGRTQSGTALLSVDGGTRTVGRLELLVSSTLGLLLKGPLAGPGATLEMRAGSGIAAVIDATGNDNVVSFKLSNLDGLQLLLTSDTRVITRGSGTFFTISAPRSGNGQLIKEGAGTLLLEGASTATGGVQADAGILRFATVSQIGTGPIILSGGALHVISSTTLPNEFAVLGGNSTIAAVSNNIVTLSGPSLITMANSRLTFGLSGSAGEIKLAFGQIAYGNGTSFVINQGNLRFGDAHNARHALFAKGDGLVEIRPFGVLDTGGFAARIANLDFDGGTLRSSTGVLNVEVHYTNGQSDNSGTIIATAGADRLTFIGKSALNVNFSATVFSGWSDANDSIRFVGSTSPDSITGTVQADRMFGNAGDDTLRGNAGNDLLNGQAGTDTTIGGPGDDTHFVDTSGDIVVEALNEGNDLVVAGADFVLPDHVERLTLQGGARQGTGNSLDNTIIGSNGNDTLLSGLDGNDAINGRDGADVILGGNGDDVLIGGSARDTLTGGPGSDRFIFRDGDMNPNRAGADIITDFDQGLDERIVLTNVDADVTLAGNQTLKFIGTASFSGAPGELRYTHFAGDTYLEGNTNADTTADFMIRLNGLYTLDITDFIGVSL